jgi:outer membrane protein assembly factor BamD (BamD/ComL family)
MQTSEAAPYSGGSLILFGVALALLAAPVNVPAADLLNDGYNAMYNLNFDEAHRDFQAWEQLHPEDPFGPVSDAAAYLFFEFERLKILRSEFFVENHKFFGEKRVAADQPTKKAFEGALLKSKQLSDAMLRHDPNSERAMFAAVMRIALHADYLALIEKQYWQALNEIKEARNDADVLLAKYPESTDANLAAGVENYLLSQKAGPVRLFLRMTGAQTDKETGVAKLRIVANDGHYLKPYAKILLAIAALRDGDKKEAEALMTELAHQFPGNDLFRSEAAKLSCTANCK